MKLNEECYKYVENYLDPDNKAFNKRIYYNWIVDNFGEKQVEACVKEVKRINEHAKGVERGVYNTYLKQPYSRPKKPKPPPNPPRVKVRNCKTPIKPFSKDPVNFFDLKPAKKSKKSKYDELIRMIIEQEKKR